MIADVSFDKITYNDPPHRFEAGTPPIMEAIGLGAAIDYLSGLDREAIHHHEADLLAYGTAALHDIPGVKIHGASKNKGAILSFSVEGTHPHDLATYLDRSGVALRAGHHCCQPLMRVLGVTATARASFAMYNVRSDIDRLADGIKKAKLFFA